MKSQKTSKNKSEGPSAQFKLSPRADLQPKLQEVQLAVARRAHELFEARGREHGHDVEDWLQAESELLCPVSVAMSESGERVRVLVNIAGFQRGEIEASVEPHRITVLGKKKSSTRKREIRATGQPPSRLDQILQLVDLATEVVPEQANVQFQAGALIFELRVAKNSRETAA
jgi:HSP20 family molecular chaperone IbpA